MPTAAKSPWPWSQWLLFAITKAGRRIDELKSLPPRVALDHLGNKALAVLGLVRRRVRARTGTPSPDRSPYYVGGLDPIFQRVRDAAIIAGESYSPQPIDCRLVLFRSAQGDARACDPVGVWKRLTPELEVVPAQGNHVTLIRKPFAGQLAAAISCRLAH